MDGIERLKAHAQEFSKKFGLACTVKEEAGKTYAIVESLGVNAGKFNIPTTDLLFIASEQYPIAAMDMFWVDERLTLCNGTLAPASEEVTEMLGKRWRRFSRHRGPGSPAWDPNQNGIEQQYLLAAIDLEPSS